MLRRLIMSVCLFEQVIHNQKGDSFQVRHEREFVVTSIYYEVVILEKCQQHITVYTNKNTLDFVYSCVFIYIYNTFDFTLVAILLRYLLYIFVYDVCMFIQWVFDFLYFIVFHYSSSLLFVFVFVHISIQFTHSFIIYITYDYFSVLFIYCSSLLLSYNMQLYILYFFFILKRYLYYLFIHCVFN